MKPSQDIKRFFIRAYFSVKSDEWLHIDAKVLNSVVHLPKAIPCFERHATIEVGIQSILKIFCDER